MRMHARPVALVAIALSLTTVAACGSTTGGGSGGGGGGGGSPTAEEQHLLDGVRLDLQGRCEPHREDLPRATLGAIQCSVEGDRIGVRLFLFNTEGEALDAYLALTRAAGIELRENDGATLESAYMPGEDSDPRHPVAQRDGYTVDSSGHASYFATIPSFVVATVESRDADAESLSTYAWQGNQDTPGAPTLWRDGTPVNPNGEKG
jgi:hypothetical protein